MTYTPSSIEVFRYNERLVIFHPPSNQLYVLNPTGRFIWEQFVKGTPEQKIVKQLAAVYSISYDQALADVKACLAQWHQAGFFFPAEQIKSQASQPHPFCKDLVPPPVEQGPICPFIKFLKLAGQDIQVCFGTKELEEIFLSLLGYLETAPVKTPHLSITVHFDDEQFFVSVKEGELYALDSLDKALSLVFFKIVEQCYRKNYCLAVLHAGAVGWKGRGIVFAGIGGSGKSTLIAGLQQEGFVYLADDVCPLQAGTGELIPVPMCQSLKAGSWETVKEYFPFIASSPVFSSFNRKVKYLPPRTGVPENWSRTWLVNILVFPSFERESAAPSFNRIDSIEALGILINSGSLCGRSNIKALFDWITSKKCFSLKYTQTDDAIKMVHAIMRKDMVTSVREILGEGRTG